nr:DUF58 domain-containing protein [Ardenticatena sp.]
MRPQQETPPLLDATFLRRLEHLTLATRRARRGLLQGERRSPKRGVSVEFADYRPYVPGDDLRQLDWNVYARLERFFIKLFVEEEDQTVHILLDASRSMAWGSPPKLRLAAQIAAAIGYIALNNLDRVTLTRFGAERVTLPPRRGRQAVLALLDFLQQTRAEGTTNVGEHLRAYAATARHPGPLILITDLLDPTWQSGLRAVLARQFDITLLHILAPDERSPDFFGDWRLRDVETGETVEVTLDGTLLQAYHHHFDDWLGEVRNWCQARSVMHLLVPSETALDAVVFGLLQRYGVVR